MPALYLMKEPLRFKTYEVFVISKTTAALTGVIESGSVRTGDEVLVSSPAHKVKAVVAAVEINRSLAHSAEAGMSVGLLLYPFDPVAVQDGITFVAGGEKIVSLVVSGS
jgi:translation elongation factor EF-Tu-like GTPase